MARFRRPVQIPGLEMSDLHQQAVTADLLRKKDIGPEVAQRPPPYRHFNEQESQEISARNAAMLQKAREYRGHGAGVVGDRSDRVLKTDWNDANGYLGMYNPGAQDWTDTHIGPEGEQRRVGVKPDNVILFGDKGFTPSTFGHEMIHREHQTDDNFLEEYDAYSIRDKPEWDALIKDYVDYQRKEAMDYGMTKAEAEKEYTVENQSSNLARKVGINNKDDRLPRWEMEHGADTSKFGFPEYSMVPQEYNDRQYIDARDKQSYWARELRK